VPGPTRVINSFCSAFIQDSFANGIPKF
jgi:hypothetical protein